MSDQPDFDEAVRLRAYQLWQQAGAPESSDLYFWLQAEADIRAERQVPPPDEV